MDLTVGCRISFTERVFGGSHWNPEFLGMRTVVGVIIKDSYGKKRGQHTFTIEVEEAEGHDADKVLSKGKIRRKGRNVYKDCRLLEKPDNHVELKVDKHARGAAANERKYRGWIKQYNDDPTDEAVEDKVYFKIPLNWLEKHEPRLAAKVWTDQDKQELELLIG